MGELFMRILPSRWRTNLCRPTRCVRLSTSSQKSEIAAVFASSSKLAVIVSATYHSSHTYPKFYIYSWGCYVRDSVGHAAWLEPARKHLLSQFPFAGQKSHSE